jgi:hypothetical protein
LYDIDQADFESTLKFMRRFTERHGSSGKQTVTTTYCDQVGWL